VIRLSPNKTGDYENIFDALGLVSSRAATPLLAALRSDSLQAIDLQETYLLPTRRHLASLSRSAARKRCQEPLFTNSFFGSPCFR
jgi:hypothetical protein